MVVCHRADNHVLTWQTNLVPKRHADGVHEHAKSVYLSHIAANSKIWILPASYTARKNEV